MKCKAMIVSVGGTTAPLVKSLTEYQPEFVSFFASQDSCDKITIIKGEVMKGGVTVAGEITLVDDVNDLFHCHDKAEEAVKRVMRKGYSKDEVIVDYTGGTKNMSVALALASITHGFSFSYVGGQERTKDGLGVVVDGKEEVFRSINPWDFLAIEERKKIALLINECQYKAAKALSDGLADKSVKNKSLFKRVGVLIRGYYNWDLFRHKEAAEDFKKARLDELVESVDPVIRSFARASRELQERLDQLARADRKPSIPYMLDIYSNAERRYQEGKVDDAILRLYRILEMAAKARLYAYGIDTSDVPAEKVPESIREEFIRKHRDAATGRIKIPQNAAFSLLKELADDLGKAFEMSKGRFQDIQGSRNDSYLAHGLTTSKDESYKRFKDFILSLGVINEGQATFFPRMEDS